MREELTSGDLYCVEHQAIEDVLASIPPEFRRKPRLLRQNIRMALADVFRRGQTVEWLISKLGEWIKSAETKTKHFREVTTWLDDEGYDEDPKVWKTRENRAQSDPVDKQTGRAKVNPIWSDQFGYGTEANTKHTDSSLPD